MLSRLFHRTTLIFLGATLLSSATARGESLRHLFLDPAFLQSSENTSLHVHAPERREVVIRADQPWEKLMISFFLTVREEEGKLRMWYICRDADNEPNLAYAESTDGVNWVKPKLGIVNYRGSTENNLVGVPGVEGVVFQDPKARNVGEKYVYLTRLKGAAIYRYHSPDGLRWQRDEKPFSNIASDTQTVTFWDENLGRYVLFLRGRGEKPGSKEPRRTVTRATTDDLTKPLAITLPQNSKEQKAFLKAGGGLPTVLEADASDPAESDVYNISAQPYPLDRRWYVGFPSFFQRQTNPANPAATNYGRVEVQFVGSRDGIRWERYDREPYAAPGLAGSESANVIFMGTGMVVRGDEIWQYGTGFHSHHGDVAARKAQTDGVIHRYVQRVDGFVSLEFAPAGGNCVTAPVKVDGAMLKLNVDTGALGTMRAALLDGQGKPHHGFELEQCDVLRTNATGAVVSWQGRTDLSPLAGKSVQVAFAGSRARLYSFYFDAAP
ncbi:hypothetical protein AYO49_01155 [Verrucomicrobiaceae bacterium SCGC AG-212-N21]|nr:hypothetical protein AYO49_01155 [Verrucomicrobiaceae bacterium SCGC AG-212-N21]